MNISKILCALALCLIQFSSFGQWTRTSTNTYLTTLTDNVGIGTTSPRSPLEVQVKGDNTKVQSALILQQINPGSPNNQAGVSLDFGIGNTNVNNNIEGRISLRETYWATRPKMVFSLWDPAGAMQDRMTINTNGNVGIGVADPDASLTVFSNYGGGKRIKIGDLGTTTKKPAIFLQANADQTNKGYFGMQVSPTGYANDFAIVSANDSQTPRFLHIGVNANDDPSGAFTPKVSINTQTGSMGIGTVATGGFKLAVEGSIGAREINVTTASPWPDYVFEEDYDLPSLESLQKYVLQHKHLPEIPSATTIKANGANLGEMNMLLLKKVEELTLYLIEQNKVIRDQQQRLDALEKNSHP
jgi:hypothetical protein